MWREMLPARFDFFLDEMIRQGDRPFGKAGIWLVEGGSAIVKAKLKPLHF